jgi:hypothetical protein
MAALSEHNVNYVSTGSWDKKVLLNSFELLWHRSNEYYNSCKQARGKVTAGNSTKKIVSNKKLFSFKKNAFSKIEENPTANDTKRQLSSKCTQNAQTQKIKDSRPRKVNK